MFKSAHSVRRHTACKYPMISVQFHEVTVMLPFRKILFLVDYSSPCMAIVPAVQEMASRFSAELTVCHAYAPLDAIIHSEPLVTDPELQVKAQAFEKERVRKFALHNFPGREFDAIAELGEPGSVIDRLAEQHRADLVMLATRDHGPVRRLLLGSITAKVLHDVSAVHPVRVPDQSIVCALDHSLEAEAVLRAAAALATEYSAELWIVHVRADSARVPGYRSYRAYRATHGSRSTPDAGTEDQAWHRCPAYRNRRPTGRWHPPGIGSKEGGSADRRPRPLQRNLQPFMVASLCDYSRLALPGTQRLSSGAPSALVGLRRRLAQLLQ